MNKNAINLEFPITLYGAIEPYNDVLSKARCRIFYKYGNRNGTYITDEFANELISTLHYVPVKGIFESGDYTDHGQVRSEGRIYGIVPENNNFAWEPHLDEDGVEREYACTDVLLFTALYPEAAIIAGKSQSMELYEPSIEYHMGMIRGQKYAIFDHGSFLGLQVLGEEVEPCFEGAAFYTLQNSIEDIIRQIKDYSIGGISEMSKIKFKLSDDQKYTALWHLLNDEYNEEGDWTCSYSIVDVYDEYVLAVNIAEGRYERVYYTKNDELDSVELGERVPVYIVDITESEKATLDTLRQLNGGTYECVKDTLLNAETYAQNLTERDTKIDEKDAQISTLNTEVENAQATYNELKAQYDELAQTNTTLNEENEALRNYKHDIETQQKTAVLDEYSAKLAPEILESYRSNFDAYSVEELDMHLAYELKKSSGFEKDNHETGFIPKSAPLSGVDAILSRYKK